MFCEGEGRDEHFNYLKFQEAKRAVEEGEDLETVLTGNKRFDAAREQIVEDNFDLDLLETENIQP